MLNGRLSLLSIALVFIHAMPSITAKRYPHEPMQKVTRTLVLSSPLSFTKAKIAIMTIQIVKRMNDKIMLSWTIKLIW